MVYNLVRGLLNIFLILLYRPQIEGRPLVPSTGPAVLCSNHSSWWDPVTIGYLSRRQVYFMAKEELFKGPLGLILPALGTFPVKRGRPDRRAIRQALKILERGDILGLFPEGTRGADIRQAEPGVALLSSKGNAPAIPVAICGPYRLGGRIKVIVGEPLHLNGRDHAANSNQVMEAIASLMEEHVKVQGGGEKPV